MSKRYAKKFWAGFEGGKIAELSVDMGWGGYGTGDLIEAPMLFTTRREARKKFQDVRRVEVRELPKKRPSSQSEEKI